MFDPFLKQINKQTKKLPSIRIKLVDIKVRHIMRKHVETYEDNTGNVSQNTNYNRNDMKRKFAWFVDRNRKLTEKTVLFCFALWSRTPNGPRITSSSSSISIVSSTTSSSFFFFCSTFFTVMVADVSSMPLSFLTTHLYTPASKLRFTFVTCSVAVLPSKDCWMCSDSLRMVVSRYLGNDI